MVIQQKHIIIFQYPQDYEAEYEFCKTKGDEWVHKGKDTRCSVYEHEISYNVGASCRVQTEREGE